MVQYVFVYPIADYVERFVEPMDDFVGSSDDDVTVEDLVVASFVVFFGAVVFVGVDDVVVVVAVVGFRVVVLTINGNIRDPQSV